MSEPCRSISKPADSPQPPRSQSAALPPMPNMNQNNGVMDNLQVDAAAEEILQFINQVTISNIFPVKFLIWIGDKTVNLNYRENCALRFSFLIRGLYFELFFFYVEFYTDTSSLFFYVFSFT